MSRVKVTRKSGGYVAVCKLDSFDKINSIELDILMRFPMKGLVKVTAGNTKKIEYSTTYSQTLLEYLQRGVSVNNLFLIVLSVIGLIKSLESNKLLLKNLLMDISGVFIDTNPIISLQFIYFPLENKCSPVSIVEFIRDVFFEARIKDTPQMVAAAESFIKYVNNIRFFSVADMEEFVVQNCPSVYAQHNGNKSGFISDNVADYINHYSGNGAHNPPNAYNAPNPPNAYNVPGRNVNSGERDTPISFNRASAMSNGTIVLNHSGDYENNERFKQQKTSYCPTFAYLMIGSSNTRVGITRTPFDIGSMQSANDYCIANKAISRQHATITMQDNQYYITDNNSTNKTYVNGQELLPGHKAKLTNGTVVLLANERCVFCLGKE